MAILPRPWGAGPVSTAPVLPLNCEPWQGQTKIPFPWSYSTVQPACGHTASKARKVPARGCSTIAGSPVAGSVKVAAPATGTSLAGPILVPGGCAAAVVGRVEAGDGVGTFDADGEPVVGDDAVAVATELGGALGSDPTEGTRAAAGDELCRSRPMPAIAPVPKTATAPVPSVNAPTRRRRSISTFVAASTCAAFSTSRSMNGHPTGAHAVSRRAKHHPPW